MTDETSGPVASTEAHTEDLDPRVSTPEDGFPVFSEEDSEEVQAQLDTDPEGYDESAANVEDEH